MLIGGFLKFSLIDYPGTVSAVIFTQGCPFRCHFCHNAELVIPKKFNSPISLDSIVSFLDRRKGKLDGVVFTGGEPTLQTDLIPSIELVKEKGYLVKLDSSGINPQIISTLLERKLIDYIAMDIKAPLEKYQSITPTFVKQKKIQESIELILSSSIQHEFRTTLIKSLHSPEDILSMAKSIRGAQRYVLQRFRADKTLNPNFVSHKSFSNQELSSLKPAIEKEVLSCSFR